MIDLPRFAVHLTIEAVDLQAAKQLAATIARSVSFLPEVQTVETTLTEEQNPGVRHWVFCDRLADDGRRCVRLNRHPAPCRSRLSGKPAGCLKGQ